MRNSLKKTQNQELEAELLRLKNACRSAKKEWKKLKAKYKSMLALLEQDNKKRTLTNVEFDLSKDEDPFVAMTYLLPTKPIANNGKQAEIKKNMGRIKKIQKSRTSAITPDDLTLIDGIGPKIQKLLNENEITTFDDLANQKVNHLRIILNKAGKGFKMQNPSLWPKQALQLKSSR